MKKEINNCEKCGKSREENDNILHIVKAKIQDVGKNQLQVCDECFEFWSVDYKDF